MFGRRLTLALLAVIALTLGACTAATDRQLAVGVGPGAHTGRRYAKSRLRSAEDSEEPTASASDDAGAGIPLEAAESADVGPYLTGEGGMTLYTFTNDTKDSGKSVCNDDCAAAWPPLLAEAASGLAVGDGVNGTITIITRDDGGKQVAYNGWPLYYFANDAAPGDTNGHEVGDVWFVAGAVDALPSPTARVGTATTAAPVDLGRGRDVRALRTAAHAAIASDSGIPRRIAPSATLLRAVDRASVTTTDRPILGRPAELATEPRRCASRVPRRQRCRADAGDLDRQPVPWHPPGPVRASTRSCSSGRRTSARSGPDDVGDVLAATFLAALVVTAIAWLAFQDRARGALFVTPALLGFLLYGHVANFGVPAAGRACRLDGGHGDRARRRAEAARPLDRPARRGAPRRRRRARRGRARHDHPDRGRGGDDAAGGRRRRPDAARRRPPPRSATSTGSSTTATAPTARSRRGYGVAERPDAVAARAGLRGPRRQPRELRRDRAVALDDDEHDAARRADEGRPGDEQQLPAALRALQGSLVARQFQALGYRYLHLGSWWNPTRTDSAADRNYNADGVSGLHRRRSSRRA